MDEKSSDSEWKSFLAFDASEYRTATCTLYDSGPGAKLPMERNKKTNICVLVRKIPRELSKDGIINLFRRHNIQPLGCQLIKNSNETGPSSSIVTVKTLQEAIKAIQSLHRRPPFDLRVTLTEPKDDHDKKKEFIEKETFSLLRKSFGQSEEDPSSSETGKAESHAEKS